MQKEKEQRKIQEEQLKKEMKEQRIKIEEVTLTHTHTHMFDFRFYSLSQYTVAITSDKHITRTETRLLQIKLYLRTGTSKERRG